MYVESEAAYYIDDAIVHRRHHVMKRTGVEDNDFEHARLAKMCFSVHAVVTLQIVSCKEKEKLLSCLKQNSALHGCLWVWLWSFRSLFTFQFHQEYNEHSLHTHTQCTHSIR